MEGEKIDMGGAWDHGRGASGAVDGARRRSVRAGCVRGGSECCYGIRAREKEALPKGCAPAHRRRWHMGSQRKVVLSCHGRRQSMVERRRRPGGDPGHARAAGGHCGGFGHGVEGLLGGWGIMR